MNWKTVLMLMTAFVSGATASYFFIKSKVKIALKEVISELIDEAVESVYPCKLIATIRYNQKSEQTIVDMSKYETLGIIGLTIDKIGEPPGPQEEALNGTSITYKTAVVYNMGGHWFWKVL